MYDVGETSNQIFCVKKVLYHTGLVLLLLSDSSLDFNYTEIGDLKKLKIAPFILINFIENAFKYGFNAEENSKISVKIIVQEGILNFVVYNKIVNKKGNEEHSLKVGLKNTFEHLAQVYADRYTVTINENLCKFFFKKLRRANIPIN